MTTATTGIFTKHNGVDSDSRDRTIRTLDRLLREMPTRGGGLHRHIMKCAVCAKAAGLSREDAEQRIDAVAQLRGAGPNETAEAVAKAHGTVTCGTRGRNRHGRTQRPVHGKPDTPPLSPQRIDERFGALQAADLIARSPIPIPDSSRAQTRLLLQTLYRPEDILLIGSIYAKRPRYMRDWLALLNQGEQLGPLIMPNPLTGRPGTTKAGKPSYRCDDAVAWPVPYLIVEFDDIPLANQAALVDRFANAGLIDCAVWSGGKSLHCWLRVDAVNSADWNRRVRSIHRSLIRYGADPSTGNPSRLSRLPGALRPGKDSRVQSLLYLRNRRSVESELKSTRPDTGSGEAIEVEPNLENPFTTYERNSP